MILGDSAHKDAVSSFIYACAQAIYDSLSWMDENHETNNESSNSSAI